MNDFESSVKKTIAENNLFSRGETVAVACSGGVDSMSILDFLNKNKKLFNNLNKLITCRPHNIIIIH